MAERLKGGVTKQTDGNHDTDNAEQKLGCRPAGKFGKAAQVMHLAFDSVERGLAEAIVIRERQLNLVLLRPFDGERNCLLSNFGKGAHHLIDEQAKGVGHYEHQEKEEGDRRPFAAPW